MFGLETSLGFPANVKILLQRFNVKIIRKGRAELSFNSR
jgi:hypothetical protein